MTNLGPIIKPLRTFLDTNHLVNIAHLRAGRELRGGQDERRVAAYRILDEWLKVGRCVPLFYEPMSYEWIRQQSADGARQIAAVLDSGITVKQVPPDLVVFILEALGEAQRIEPYLGFPGFQIVQDFASDGDLAEWFNEFWPHRDENATTIGHFARRGQRPTVVAFVRTLAAYIKAGNDLWRVALDGERHSLAQTRKTQREHGAKGHVPDAYRRFWLKSALGLDTVIRRMAPSLDPDEILRQIDLDACPAIQLKLDAYWNYAKATSEPKAGDFVDLTMFGALPYADVALIENRMHEFGRQAHRSGYQERVHRDAVTMTKYVVRLQEG